MIKYSIKYFHVSGRLNLWFDIIVAHSVSLACAKQELNHEPDETVTLARFHWANNLICEYICSMARWVHSHLSLFVSSGKEERAIFRWCHSEIQEIVFSRFPASEHVSVESLCKTIYVCHGANSLYVFTCELIDVNGFNLLLKPKLFEIHRISRIFARTRLKEFTWLYIFMPESFEL